MVEDHNRPAILSETVSQRLGLRIAQWLSHLDDNEERLSILMHEDAYRKVIQCSIDLMQEGKRARHPEEMCREIITNINIMLPDPSYSKVREALFIDILKEAANRISADKETPNQVDAIQDEVILQLKRPL